MSKNKKILVITSSADTLTLKDGRKEPIGYYLNELVVPVRAALDAGYEMVLATPTARSRCWIRLRGTCSLRRQ